MSILGISAGFHDASLTVLDWDGSILFAGHSERYSKVKNESEISLGLLDDVFSYGPIEHVAYYERPFAKQLRRLYSGEGVQWDQLTTQRTIEKHLFGLKFPEYSSYNHHLSHAAAGFQTSPFDRATVVVIDAIGEWDTISIWGAEYVDGQAKYKQLWRQRYPHSIGLFYSAMTQRVGLKPNEEEYILMGMAAYGAENQASYLKSHLVEHEGNITFKQNLHLGVEPDLLSHWPPFKGSVGDTISRLEPEDIAASAQSLCENLIYNVMRRAKDFAWSDNLVYMGGVALNCLANRNLGDYFEKVWIMPNPGDAGSSLGAAALHYGGRVHFNNAYLGHNIPGPYPTNSLLDRLRTEQIVGVASGRAEFGPRALGNRSLLADPRGPDIKDRVNEIKRRQKFRPFAPVILEELAEQYFDMPRGFHHSRYMQAVARCRYPDLYPAIVHHDGTSRVQTVPKDGSGIRELLEKWYLLTDCPMLLNTSLNIRGEPMVNDRSDADRFEALYGIPVLS